MQPHRYLIIGASGFIGQNIQSYLAARNYPVLGTQSKARPNALTKFDLLADRITDCVPRHFLAGVGQLQVVICAMVTNIDQCLTERETSHRINVEHTIRLIQDVAPYGAQITFLSTGYIFDGKDGYYNETDVPTPVNEYARHKREVEEYLQAHHPTALILRLDKIVGDNPEQNHMFAHWLKLAQTGAPIVSIQGSVLSPTYVGDVAYGIHEAHQRRLQGLYHLANAKFFHRGELAYQFCRALGFPTNVAERPLHQFGFADTRALKSYLNGSRFAAATNLTHTPMSDVFRRLAAARNQKTTQPS